jgi:hypothetical protein
MTLSVVMYGNEACIKKKVLKSGWIYLKESNLTEVPWLSVKLGNGINNRPSYKEFQT